MNNGRTAVRQQERLTIGLDLGDKYSQLCILDGAAEVLEEARIRTTPDALRRRFEALDSSLVAFEVGTHSPWVCRLLKACGARLPNCDSRSFARKARDAVPLALLAAIEPLLRSVEQLSEEIHSLDGCVEALADQKYAQTAAMRQITGVGALTSVTFALVLHDPYRFRRSRQVGPYLGLTPREKKSGESDPDLHISKTGNEYLRQLLVGSAHYILGPFGPECDLRRWGLHKAQGGKNAKKRAVVAVARKLAVLMHHLWLTGEAYDPQHREGVTPAPPTAGHSGSSRSLPKGGPDGFQALTSPL